MVRRIGEVNARPPSLAPTTCKVALVFPDVYPLAINSYSFQWLYHALGSRPGVTCHRFVYPLTKAGLAQVPKSLEAGAPLEYYDVVAFSLQFEEQYFRVPWFLRRASVPVTAEERSGVGHGGGARGGGERWPIVLAGGPAVSANPLPTFDLVDATCLGDLEPSLPQLLDWLAELPEVRRGRALEALADLPGWITHDLDPSKAKRGEVRRAALDDLDASPHPTAQVVPAEVPAGMEKAFPFGRTFLLEVNRGCPHACRFCVTGYHKRPFRNRSLNALRAIVEEGLRSTPVDRVTLVGSAVNEHPKFVELVEHLATVAGRVTVPSLQAASLTEGALQALAATGLKTLTVAPEACAELRGSLGKVLKDESLLGVAESAASKGFRNVKAYFLLGVPGERPEHVDAIGELVGELTRHFPRPKSTRVSVNPFVPKANTPLETFVDHYATKEGFSELKGRFKRLGKVLGSLGPVVKYSPPALTKFRVQAHLSLGGREHHRLLVELCETPRPPTWATFMGAARRVGLDLESQLVASLTSSRRPWSFVG
ncbi:MAG: radical SAM protein [Promethearchaeota archaeon]